MSRVRASEAGCEGEMAWTTETMRKPRKRGEEIDVLVCDSRDDEGRSLKYSAGRAASVWVAILGGKNR